MQLYFSQLESAEIILLIHLPEIFSKLQMKSVFAQIVNDQLAKIGIHLKVSVIPDVLEIHFSSIESLLFLAQNMDMSIPKSHSPEKSMSISMGFDAISQIYSEERISRILLDFFDDLRIPNELDEELGRISIEIAHPEIIIAFLIELIQKVEKIS